MGIISDQDKLKEYAAGQRVELAPHLDDWMRGDRFGVVERIGRRFVYVKLDRSGRVHGYLPSSLTVIAR